MHFLKRFRKMSYTYEGNLVYTTFNLIAYLLMVSLSVSLSVDLSVSGLAVQSLGLSVGRLLCRLVKSVKQSV